MSQEGWGWTGSATEEEEGAEEGGEGRGDDEGRQMRPTGSHSRERLARPSSEGAPETLDSRPLTPPVHWPSCHAPMTYGEWNSAMRLADVDINGGRVHAKVAYPDKKI